MRHIIYLTCLILISCSSNQADFINASGCFAEYSQNGKIKSFPIAKVVIKEKSKIVFIENDGTSSAISNSTVFDINKPSKIYCLNKEKTEKINILFY